MLYIDTTLEDLRLISENPSCVAEGPWQTRLVDQATGEARQLELASTQLAAIMFLAISGEEAPAPLVDAMYALAEPALQGLEPKFRPIP